MDVSHAGVQDAITLSVGLLSGKTATVRAGLHKDEDVSVLMLRAQTALGAVGKGRLVDAAGRFLDASELLKNCGVQNGETLTLHISPVQIQASEGSFAAILGDGSVVTWGSAGKGGNSSAVQDQLKNVTQIQASRRAFAAILGDNSVVTWGDAGYGGDSSAVQNQLRNVQQIRASDSAFAAILGDGSVVTWGAAAGGGNSSDVQDQLQNVQQIQASDGAFAAILGDGSLRAWGNYFLGGHSVAVQDRLKDVRQIQASGCAFAAILGDGSVVTWGPTSGGDSCAVQDQLRMCSRSNLRVTVLLLFSAMDRS